MTKSIYIHIPFCISKCSYCDFYSVERKFNFVPEQYVFSLCNEIKYKCKTYNVQEINTIYIGGGTPSLLTKNQIELISKTLNDIGFSKDVEFTFEVNPDDVTEELISCLWNSGINRISCGIQSLYGDSLTCVRRRANRNQCINALELFKSKWKGTLSLDLISGLPFETSKSFVEGLNTVIEYNPHHISLYSLTLEEGTRLEKEISSGSIKYDYDLADEMWLAGRDLLEKNGYCQYEVSNFCRKDFECRHNLVYWNHENYIGCGAAATGSLYAADGSCTRFTNKNDIDKYIKKWSDEVPADAETVEIEKIDATTSKFEFFMMGLRKLSGISSSDYKNKFLEDFPLSAEELFLKWEKEELCNITKTEKDTVYSLNKNGILYLNKFLSELNIT